jgi:hypothetical protein
MIEVIHIKAKEAKNQTLGRSHKTNHSSIMTNIRKVLTSRIIFFLLTTFKNQRTNEENRFIFIELRIFHIRFIQKIQETRYDTKVFFTPR